MRGQFDLISPFLFSFSRINLMRNSYYRPGFTDWDDYILELNLEVAGGKIELAELRSTPFGEYRYNRMMFFIKTMEKLGFSES